MTDSISPEDRAMIEHTRRVNKTLSMFVFALQENRTIPTEGQLDIVDILVELADAVRERATKQTANARSAGPHVVEGDSTRLLLGGAGARLQIEPRSAESDQSSQYPHCSAGPTIHLVAAPAGRQGVPETESNQ